MEEDLLRRAADLAERCERTATVTSTAFLTPAEQYALTNWARHRDCTLVLHGGGEGCERRAAFFLPFYLTAEDFDPAEHLRAVQFSAPFAAPGHRDYLGAILGLGIRREWVGDILVQDHGAYVFCLPSVAPALLELEQVIAAPHVAGSSMDSINNMGIFSARNVVKGFAELEEKQA